jgi:hypothetical protein
MNQLPTVFHITHWKAGSQWVREILKFCAPDRFLPQELAMVQFYDRPILPGRIYASVYTSRTKFQSILRPLSAPSYWFGKRLIKSPRLFFRNCLNFQIRSKPVINFFVMRDLRDTLVSFYFSYKISHPLQTDRQVNIRQTLSNLSEEDGMMMMLDQQIDTIADIQRSWLNSGALIIKYEDLIADEHAQFERIFDYCKIDIDRKRLHEVVSYNSFEKTTGRAPGTEDVTAHLRKGVAGDWQNHFTERLTLEFKRRYSETLIKTGYEKSNDW